MDEVAFLHRLRRLVGGECIYLRKHCRLIEILPDEGSVVLETRESLPPIQRDQYGHAAYRANDVMHVPIFGTNRHELSEDLLDLLTCLKAHSDKGRGIGSGTSQRG